MGHTFEPIWEFPQLQQLLAQSPQGHWPRGDDAADEEAEAEAQEANAVDDDKSINALAGQRMHPAYFETRFRTPDVVAEWPREFVILSAYQTTGEQWPQERNFAADRELEQCLRERGGWLRRITGFSPTTGHAEPSWATEMSLDEACDSGLQFRQDAIYHVSGDTLSVSFCDDRRALVLVGPFRERLVVAPD